MWAPPIERDGIASYKTDTGRTLDIRPEGISFLGERDAVSTLWTYYRITLKEKPGGLFFRLTGEMHDRIFGFEVDENGKALRNENGGVRFHVFDRANLEEMKPVALFSGRLVPGNVKSEKDPRLEPV